MLFRSLVALRTMLFEFRDNNGELTTEVKSRLRERLLGAYLSEWTQFEPIERLREAFELARPAGTLCRALSWRDCIASLADPSRHRFLRRAVALNLRQLLVHALPEAPGD